MDLFLAFFHLCIALLMLEEQSQASVFARSFGVKIQLHAMCNVVRP